MDAKGRVSVPADFRHVLQKKIRALAPGSVNREYLTHFYIDQSYATQIDDNGHLVLPQKLREHVGIVEQAHFYGWIDTFRIASPENYEKTITKTDLKTGLWLKNLERTTHPLSLLPILDARE